MKSWPPFLNACCMTGAASGARCTFPPALFQDGAVAVQELVLSLSPFYKQENSASERLGTRAGMAWLIKSMAGTQTHVYGTSHPSLCAWTLYFTVLKTKTAVQYEATMFLYATSLAQHISHSAFCHIKPTDLVLIPLEYYTIRCWARRKKNQTWMVKETRDSCFPHPRLFPPKHRVYSYISLQILGGPTCSRLCQRLYTLPHTRHLLWWRHFYTLNINIRSQKEHRVKKVWCMSDIFSRVGQCADLSDIFSRVGQCANLISVACTKSVTSNPANGKSEHKTNSLHVFVRTFKHLTNRKEASLLCQLSLQAEGTMVNKTSSMSIHLPG